MTANRNLKRQVRARAAKTGESYTASLRHVRPNPTPPHHLRLAVAQIVVREDPRDEPELRASGREIRRLMREAHAAGARIVHFPEGATCFPHKRIMSVDGPDRVGPADWSRARWDVLRSELTAIAQLAATLKLWTVLGSIHQLTPPHRPHNSLYVLSDRGALVTRYDERYLSNTKVSYLYTPGAAPRVFDVDGVRFGCLLGMEVHYPELFVEYEQLDVDCVLFASTGSPDGSAVFATEAAGHAATNGYWIGFAMSGHGADQAPAGIVGPDGRWLARCAPEDIPALAITDLDQTRTDLQIALRRARPWRRTARSGIYDAHVVVDARSEHLDSF